MTHLPEPFSPLVPCTPFVLRYRLEVGAYETHTFRLTLQPCDLVAQTLLAAAFAGPFPRAAITQIMEEECLEVGCYPGLLIEHDGTWPAPLEDEFTRLPAVCTVYDTPVQSVRHLLLTAKDAQVFPLLARALRTPPAAARIRALAGVVCTLAEAS